MFEKTVKIIFVGWARVQENGNSGGVLKPTHR